MNTVRLANDRMKLFHFGADRIGLFNSVAGNLVMITPLIAELIRIIVKPTRIADLDGHFNLGEGSFSELATQLDKLKELGFVIDASGQLIDEKLSLAETASICPPVKAFIFHVTQRCNLRCIHCYANAVSECDDEDLNLELIRSVIADYGQMGGLSIDITGGEPLVRPDIIEILQTARQERLHVRLLSNGELLADEKIAHMVGKNTDEIIISLDGLKDTHDWIRNKSGQFETVVKAVRQLVAMGYRVGITTLITYRSLAQLSEVAELLAAIGVEKWNLNLPRLVGRATVNNEICKRTLKVYFGNIQKTLGIIKQAYDIAEDGKVKIMGELLMFPKKQRHALDRSQDPLYGVYEEGRPCWNATLCVFANGDIVPCLFFRELVYGNVKEMPLSALYQSAAREALLKAFGPQRPDQICPYLKGKANTTKFQKALRPFTK